MAYTSSIPISMQAPLSGPAMMYFAASQSQPDPYTYSQQTYSPMVNGNADASGSHDVEPTSPQSPGDYLFPSTSEVASQYSSELAVQRALRARAMMPRNNFHPLSSSELERLSSSSSHPGPSSLELEQQEPGFFRYPSTSEVAAQYREEMATSSAAAPSLYPSTSRISSHVQGELYTPFPQMAQERTQGEEGTQAHYSSTLRTPQQSTYSNRAYGGPINPPNTSPPNNPQQPPTPDYWH